MKLEFIPVKTRVVMPPKDEIWDIIDRLDVRDGDIVFVTSKIMAIHQGRCLVAEGTDKEELVRQNSTRYTPFENRGGFRFNLAINQNVLIPNAGLDESNANGHYILWPENTDGLCRDIRTRLMKNHNINRLGVVSTDSHTTPLRWGVTGIAIGLAGIHPLRDLRGDKDIFGRVMHSTCVNILDALTGIAVLLMGETAECKPIVILRDYKGIEFSENGSMDEFNIAPEDDLYSSLLEVMQKN